MTVSFDQPRTEDPEHWYCANMVGVPVPLLGSTTFNRCLRRVTIHGTRETHPGLFRLLARCGTQAEAAEVFAHYMELEFGLGPPPEDAAVGRRRGATSYVELLRGWGVDSNSAKAAVLKGWVESRFGLVPVFHKERLGLFPSPGWIAYLAEKTDPRFHDNCIHQQFDLVYEFCQWSIRRFKAPGPRFVRLWRGTNNVEEQLVEGDARTRHCIVRLNNLVSFSASKERADEFGDWVLETEVPTVKLLFFPGLLAGTVLDHEGEYLVIGGRYKVRAHHGWF
ncbi:NAD(+)--dinitrogen-reductase ADP-D-ribosyltransferase [Rhodovulum sp. PH10]|uniref:NAD(+)--dinitrogen-reductase ADP-D-ribosyltransferase n=1 Tax=Rhodovulum sp. PH10 TaxID=1187851 RepID=UPI00027C222F|nr:NAD(+)--dinitrogen-reductase ADP-D-ribosyltransferase [Rhodovulum sp. PH10]EJW10899.1 NAD(+)--dinitrogen-reductase ADP-D-ribosyltransferase [Rhodovulum sp. PH10]